MATLNNTSYFGKFGTGKTTYVKNNLEYDYATTLTNRCLLNLKTENKSEPKTLYSILGMFNIHAMFKSIAKLTKKTLWVDEMSMINKSIWNYLMVLCLKYGTKLIITGDINQIAPINENKIDINSIVSKNLFGKITYLTKQWRCDTHICNLADDIIDGNMKNIKYESNIWLTYKRHLAYTNNACNYINNKILKHNNLIFRFNYIEENYNSVDISNGVILSARITRHTDNIFKRDLWIVSKKLQDGYQLTNLFSNEIFDFCMNNMKYFELGFCTTVHSMQGATIDDDICIHEVSKMIMFEGLLYTAITRTKKMSQLHFYDNNFPIVNKDLPQIDECDFDTQELSSL